MQKAVIIEEPSLKRRQELRTEERKRAKELYAKLKAIMKKLEVKLEELEGEKRAEFRGLSSADILVVHSDGNLMDKIDFSGFKNLKGVIVVNPRKEEFSIIHELNKPKLLIGSSKGAIKTVEKDVERFVKRILREKKG